MLSINCYKMTKLTPEPQIEFLSTLGNINALNSEIDFVSERISNCLGG